MDGNEEAGTGETGVGEAVPRRPLDGALEGGGERGSATGRRSGEGGVGGADRHVSASRPAVPRLVWLQP
jgi:hypothetical protein